jgi:hypothetical protein
VIMAIWNADLGLVRRIEGIAEERIDTGDLKWVRVTKARASIRRAAVASITMDRGLASDLVFQGAPARGQMVLALVHQAIAARIRMVRDPTAMAQEALVPETGQMGRLETGKVLMENGDRIGVPNRALALLSGTILISVRLPKSSQPSKTQAEG